jgi:hypothetical protein
MTFQDYSSRSADGWNSAHSVLIKVTHGLSACLTATTGEYAKCIYILGKSLSKLSTLVYILLHFRKYTYQNRILCKIMCFIIRFNLITYHKRFPHLKLFGPSTLILFQSPILP